MNVGKRIINGIGILKKQGPGTLWNKVLTKRIMAKRPDYCPNQPIFAQIEITTFCNLRCATCREFVDDMSEEAKRSKHLSFESFKTILSKLPHVRKIRVNGVGEPLLNPDLIEMIRYAADKGINVHFFSNGTLLKGEIIHRLLKSGVEGIIFSIDGATSETFDALRRGARLTEVSENIRNFVKMINNNGRNSPVVTAITTISKDNIQEVPQIVEFVHSIGIRNMMVKRMIPWVGALQNKVVSQEELKSIQRAQELANRLHLNLVVGKLLDIQMAGEHPGLKDRKFLCNWPWNSTYISVDGWVTPCCNIFDPEKINFGNIFSEDFRDIWNSQRMRGFRSLFNNGLPGVCSQACLLDSAND